MRAAAVGAVLAAIVAFSSVACSSGDPAPDDGVPPPDIAASGDSAAGVPNAMPGGGMGPAADTALGGTRWILIQVGGTAARSGDDPERAAYIEFSPSEGRASGNASCNRFSGPYSLSGDSLSFGALISTKMACADSALNAQEVAFLGALEQVRLWRMAGDTLVLSGAGGDVARFRAGPRDAGG